MNKVKSKLSKGNVYNLIDWEKIDYLKHRKKNYPFIHFVTVIAIFSFLLFIEFKFEKWWLWLLGWFIQSLILVGFTSVIHECIHNLFFNNKKFNSFLGILVSLILIKNFYLHKYFHLSHHQYTNLDNDPEQPLVFNNKREYIFQMLRMILPKGIFFFTIKFSLFAFWDKHPNFAKMRLQKSNIKTNSIFFFCYVLILIISFIMFPIVIIKGYLIPLIGSFILGFLIMLPEHYETNQNNNPFENTRTIISTPFIRFLYWNNNYHTVHHAFPTIPYFLLPVAFSSIEEEILFKEKSYFSFHKKTFQKLSGLLSK